MTYLDSVRLQLVPATAPFLTGIMISMVRDCLIDFDKDKVSGGPLSSSDFSEHALVGGSACHSVLVEWNLLTRYISSNS